MTKSVGGAAVLLQPSALLGAEARRGADSGAMPAEGFALMLAGLLAGPQAAAPAPAPMAEPAPSPTPARQASALPWDVLAAAAEETSRLAAAFQMPQAAPPAAVADGSEAAVPTIPGLALPEAAPTLPQSVSEAASPALAAPAMAQPPVPTPMPVATASPPAIPPADAILPEASPTGGRREILPEMAPTMPATASAASPAPLPGGLAEATPEAGVVTPAVEHTPPPASPAGPPMQARQQAAAPLPIAAPLAPDPATLVVGPAAAALQPGTAASAFPALPQAAQAAAAAVPQPQLRPGVPAAIRPSSEEAPPGADPAASAPVRAAPTLLPTAVTAPAPPGEVALHPPTPPSEVAPMREKATAEPNSTAALPGPAPVLAEALPEPQPTLLPLGHGQASSTAPAAPTVLPAQTPLPQNRLAAEAAPQLVLRMAQAAKKEGVETISVDLRPPELGRVELQLTFRDGTVQVVMRAEQADTFEALRHERHNLMQQMEQAGLQLGGSGLDLQHGPLPQPKPQPEQAFASARHAATDPEQEDGAQAGATATPRRAASDSLIDIIT